MGTPQVTQGPPDGQFLRYAQLVVSKDSRGIDLSNMRIRFEVRASDVETPNTAVIRVYNLKPDTVNIIVQRGNPSNSFNMVTLTAGYQNGNKANIFQGDIKQFRFGKERNVDSYLDIMAGDGDRAYNESIVNQTFPPGATDSQQLSVLAAAMGLPVANTTEGYLTMGGILPRGRIAAMLGLDEKTLKQLEDNGRSVGEIDE